MADDRPGGGKLNAGDILIRADGTREELKIAVNVAIEKFRQEEDLKELTLPSSLTSGERAYVHRYCQKFGLKTKSRGSGSQRSLTVYKKEKSISSSTFDLKLSTNSIKCIDHFLKKYPVTNKENQDIGQKRILKGSGHDNSKVIIKESKFLLGSNPQVPPKVRENDSNSNRTKLPIYSYRDKVLKSIKTNQVTLITGDTGCGKTTQVGQYILEDANKRQQPCRTIITQPRRISAISVAERVAYERGEQIGQTVGYQIRLENRVSPKTCLLYCTNGVLLRLLTAGHKVLSNVTYIIIDEIHERDKFSDFLLICLRDQLKAYKNLRLILMSAALNIDLFKEYFGNCPVIHVPSMCHKVESYFLEDVLQMTDYTNKAMEKISLKTGTKPQQSFEQLKAGSVKVLKKGEVDEEQKPQVMAVEYQDPKGKDSDDAEKKDTLTLSQDTVNTEIASMKMLQISDDNSSCLDLEVKQEMDSCLKTAWVDGNEEVFDQILHLILNENVNIDFRHSETTMTTLMVASARGFSNLVEHLLEMGADPELKDEKQCWSAMDWARNFKQGHIMQIFDNYMELHHEDADEATQNEEDVSTLPKELQRRLEMYHNTFDDDKVDHNLVLKLISHICKTKQDGAILVFLPGYDDIVGIRDRLLGEKEFSKQSKYIIYTLHSMMQPSSQRKVFRRPPSGMRKIILSTNIAETSVTIDDVVFVIDSGKVKEKTFDPLTSVSALRSVWISKASALQRRGRAGRCRPGYCYHLMSRYRFHNLCLYQDAEILRTPIHELCLQTKLLAAVNVSIADFLTKAAEPPPFLMIRNSVSLLKSIDALDDEEELTVLGKLLVDLPIDPRLGKMVIFGIILKCLDPVLTIATSLAYRDPFLLPTRVDDKQRAYSAKVKFSGQSFSDHFTLSKIFKAWSKAKEDGDDRYFCSQNFVSSAAMEMVSGMRSQLLGHLKNLGLVRQRGTGDMKDLNTNSQNISVVKAAALTGVYPALLRVDRHSMKIVSETESKVRVHPSSVLYPANGHGKSPTTISADIVSHLPYDWLYFDEMTRMHTAVQVRCLTALPAVAVALLAGPSLIVDEDSFRRSGDPNSGNKGRYGYENSDSENEEGSKPEPNDDKATLKIDDWICFHGDDDALELLLLLKMKFLSSFVRRISSEGRSWSQCDEGVLQCVVNVLSEEDNPDAKKESIANDGSRRNSSDRERSGKSVTWTSGHRASPRGRGGGSTAQRGRDYDYQRPKHMSRDRRFGKENERRRNEERDAQANAQNEEDPENNDGNMAKVDRYFIVKCNNYKNLEIAMSRGIWATTKSNEKKLDRAYRDGGSIYLIFSIQGSGHFQGYAKMVSKVTDKPCSDFGSINLGGTFSVQWIQKGDLPFQFTQELTNPWNENKKVQISRDGQELEPSVGAALCSLWNQFGQPMGMNPQPTGQPGVDYQMEPLMSIPQTQLESPTPYAVMDGQPQAQVFIADAPHSAALFGAPYPPGEVRDMQPPYHAPAVYAPPQHVAGFPPQQLLQSRYPPAEVYQVHPQAFVPYRRQGGYAPRTIHYYQPPYH